MKLRTFLEATELAKINPDYTFWIEEIAYVLDGKRQQQIHQHGSASAYLSELLRYTPTVHLAEINLKKAIDVYFSYDTFDAHKAREDFEKYQILFDLIGSFVPNDAKYLSYISQFLSDICDLGELRSDLNWINDEIIEALLTEGLDLIGINIPRTIEFPKMGLKSARDYPVLNSYPFLEQYLQVCDRLMIYGKRYSGVAIIYMIRLRYRSLEIQLRELAEILVLEKNVSALKAVLEEISTATDIGTLLPLMKVILLEARNAFKPLVRHFYNNGTLFWLTLSGETCVFTLRNRMNRELRIDNLPEDLFFIYYEMRQENHNLLLKPPTGEDLPATSDLTQAIAMFKRTQN